MGDKAQAKLEQVRCLLVEQFPQLADEQIDTFVQTIAGAAMMNTMIEQRRSVMATM